MRSLLLVTLLLTGCARNAIFVRTHTDQGVHGIGEAYPVGNKAPNEFGLYDMSGNVAEWIGEYYQSYPENAVDAVIADTTLFDLRIIRGGSVWAGQPITRTYWRTGTLKEVRTPSVGFRCARD